MKDLNRGWGERREISFSFSIFRISRFRKFPIQFLGLELKFQKERSDLL